MRVPSQTLCLAMIGLVMLPHAAFGVWSSGATRVGHEPVPGRIIVKLKPDVTLSTIERGGRIVTGRPAWDRLHQQYQVTRQARLLDKGRAATLSGPLGRLHILQIDDGADPEAAARDYAALPEVEYAHPDYPVELYDAPDDPLYPHQWALNNTGQGYYHVDRLEGNNNDTLAVVYGTPDADIDAAEVFESPPDATRSVVVAIVDSGVDLDHPDLADMIWNNPDEIPDNGLDDDHNGYIDDMAGWDFAGGEGIIPGSGEDHDPTDEHGHGTHCAGIVAAILNNATGVAGVVPTARIMALKCEPMMTIAKLLEGVVYAADNGADVINMSWGLWWPVPALEDGMKHARERGVVLVASAGNDGAEMWNYPASYAQTISVSATNSDDQVTTWSTYNQFVSMSAPGQSILSLRADTTDMYGRHNEPDVHVIDSLYYLASGTSMSGPYVVAVAAYLRSLSPGLGHDSLEQILQNTADDILDPYGQGDHYPGWDKYSGAGRVNLNAALAAAPRLRAFIDTPTRGAVLSGEVDIMGSADGDDFTSYTLEYGHWDDSLSFAAITSSTAAVTDGVLGTWDLSGLSGDYVIRLRAGPNTAYVPVFAAEAPIVEIVSPADYDTVGGLIPIVGSVVAPDFLYALLEYGQGTTPSGWTVLDTVTALAYREIIAEWNLSLLPSDGLHTLRLSVYSDTGLVGESQVIVYHSNQLTGPGSWTASLMGGAGVTANYGDFDDDGLLEIVIGTDSGVHFFAADGTPKVSGMPVFPPGDYRLPVAVGNLDGDGVDDLVAVSADGILYGFPSSASPYTVTLEAPPYMYAYNVWVNCAMVFMKDINGDGLDELHYTPQKRNYPSYYLYRPDGSAWGGNFPLPEAYMDCFPADVDGDGVDEIYSYNFDSRHLMQLDTLGQAVDSILIELDSGWLWHDTLPLCYFHFSAVDIDDDNLHELILAGSYLDSVLLTENYIWAFDGGLTIKPGWPHCFDDRSPIAPEISMVTFADFNNDGLLEYLVSSNDMGGIWLKAWNLDGTSFIGGIDSLGLFAELPNPGCLHQPVVVDIDYDGIADILVGASDDPWCEYTAERILAYNPEAELIPGYPALVNANPDCNGSTRAAPMVGDLNQDGYLDFVYLWRNVLVFANLGGVVYDANRAYYPMRWYNRRLNNTAPLASEILVVCGDINADGVGPNVADLVFLVDYLFRGGPPPPDPQVANIDQYPGVNVADLTYLVAYLFQNGPEPVCE